MRIEIHHRGIVNLLGGSRGLGELDGEQGWWGLCGLLDAADVVPRLEGRVRSARRLQAFGGGAGGRGC